jgi:hypothetical protein
LTNNFLKIKSGILKKQDAFLFASIFILFTVFLNYYDAAAQMHDYQIRDEIKLNKYSYQKIDLENRVFNDSLKDTNKTANFVMKKSPWRAVLFSAVLPGLGQFYNESYWKVPIVVGLGGFLGYQIFYYNSRFLDFKNSYAQSLITDTPNGDDNLRRYREFYRNQRDQFYLYFGFFYLITLVDAYVDAHLFDFNVSDKVRFSIERKNGFNFKLSF